MTNRAYMNVSNLKITIWLIPFFITILSANSLYGMNQNLFSNPPSPLVNNADRGSYESTFKLMPQKQLKIKKQIDNKADVNAKDSNGYSELMNTIRHFIGYSELMNAILCFNGDIQPIKLLIDNKANVNAKHNDGDSALIKTIRWFNGNIQLIKFLIDNKADVNAKSNDGYSELMNAILCFNGNIQPIKLLIDNKADVSTQVIEYATSEKIIITLERAKCTLSEQKMVITFILCNKLKLQNKVFIIPKPILANIFKYLGLPTHGNAIPVDLNNMDDEVRKLITVKNITKNDDN